MVFLVYPIALALVVGLAILLTSGRRADRPALGPEVIFYVALSFVALVGLVVGVGVAAQSAGRLIGPASRDGGFASTTYSTPIGTYTYSATSDGNHDVVGLVWGGFYVLAAGIAYRIAWRRARALLATPEALATRLPLGYAYTVAGLAAVAALILGPLFAGGLFRGIAPGVNGVTGRSGGFRSAATACALLVTAFIVGRYHLRLAGDVRRTTPPAE